MVHGITEKVTGLPAQSPRAYALVLWAPRATLWGRLCKYGIELEYRRKYRVAEKKNGLMEKLIELRPHQHSPIWSTAFYALVIGILRNGLLDLPKW